MNRIAPLGRVAASSVEANDSSCKRVMDKVSRGSHPTQKENDMTYTFEHDMAMGDVMCARLRVIGG